jgi:hypothetical protein
MGCRLHDFLHFAATPTPVFAMIRLLDRAGPIHLAAALSSFQFSSPPGGSRSLCAAVAAAEHAWKPILRCRDDDPANAPSSDGGPATPSGVWAGWVVAFP